jgi:hypothetical protein
MDEQHVLVHCGKVVNVTNCEHCEEIGVVEKNSCFCPGILPNSHLDLVSN